MDDSRKSFDPRLLGETIGKRKWHLIVPLVLSLATSLVVVDVLPRIYRVESILLFETTSLLTGEMERQLLPGTGPSRAREDERHDQANVLRMKVHSPDFLGELAQEMGFLDNPAALAGAAEKKARTGDPKTPEDILRQEISTWIGGLIETNLMGSSVYQITIQGTNRELLMRLSERINTKLLEMVQNEQMGRLRAASVFTEEQIAIYKKKLDDSRRELDRFLSWHTAPAPQTTGQAANVGAVSRLAEETSFEILRIGERRDRSLATLTQVYGFNADAFLQGAQPSLALLGERLQSLERQLAFLLLERPWNDPTVIAHNSRIGEARTEIEEMSRRLARSTLLGQPERVQTDAGDMLRDQILMDALGVRKETLLQQAGTPHAAPSQASVSRSSQELAFLEEQVRINAEIYNSFLRQATSTKISEAVESEQLTRRLQILQEPQWPSKPASPNRAQVIGLGVLIGLALGAASVMAGEYMDSSVKDVRDAEEIVRAPILGTIPFIEYAYMPRSGRRLLRGKLLATVIGGILIGVIAGYFIYHGRTAGAGRVDEKGIRPADTTERIPG